MLANLATAACMLTSGFCNTGFVVPASQFSNYGAANHPGITQSSWNSCFKCSNALDACTEVSGSPNITDQFSSYRSGCSGLAQGRHGRA